MRSFLSIVVFVAINPEKLNSLISPTILSIVSLVSSGDRSAKIRTYNYPQNRVTDHRIGLTLNKLDQVMEGKMGEIIEALIIEDQIERMNKVGE